MKLTWQTFSVPKEGLTAEQNEDAAAIAPATHRAAVGDGASEGWHSGAWAAQLAMAMVTTPASPKSFTDWLAGMRASVTGLSAPVVSWYAEAKQAQGAFSTLLGISFAATKEGGIKYRAMAVGDTELIHRRGETIRTRFPLETAVDFGNRPKLLGNLAEHGDPEPEWFAGRAEPGDVFYLMTDALAEWFLRECDAGAEPWSRLDGVTSAVDAVAEYALWVQSLRQAKQLKNDDTTLVRVGVTAAV